jgi:dipeptidyl aminopeptidase/acylaminoacyl peptidase
MAALGALGVVASAQQATAPAAPLDDAAKFGAQEVAYSVALSADGSKLLFVGPDANAGSVALVTDLKTAQITAVGRADGKPLNLRACDWSGTNRLVCMMTGVTKINTVRAPVSRMLAVDASGGNVLQLGQGGDQSRPRQFDGDIVDWQNGVDGLVLMSRHYVPTVGGRTTARTEEGFGVDRIDTNTGKVTEVEKPDISAVRYISDGLGTVRIKTLTEKSSDGRLRGVNRHFYRKVGEREWQPLGVDRSDGPRMMPLAVDPTINAAYVLQTLDGRLALYRIALDGSMKTELVFASKNVDVSNVVRVGRAGRVIGVSYVTDRRMAEYFDPDYRAIARGLAQSLPNLPLLHFVSASADERLVLVRAGSDSDPGRYYLFDRDRKSLTSLLQARPPLKGMKLSEVRAVEYSAADGTRIPAYLTLPPGVTEAKGLPAIVMPHGGPEARDEWGFGWLAQFYAQRGFAVLQPNFRGSAGYGDAWFAQNGFQGWRQSIGDVCDGGRWLVKQGIADPAKLAAVGWSYGGYAVLQANVLDADLFKAVIAIAPVTDLALLKTQAYNFTNYDLVADFIGNGPHVREGSPAQQADKFKAPVLMFHGTEDVNVDIQQSQRMDKALRAAGKSSELVTYPDLDHGLRNNTVRADMLRRSEAFLRKNLNF